MTLTWPVLAPAPDTPPSGPPRPHPDTGYTLTRFADVRAALAAPSCRVPVAEPGPPGTLAGLRGAVSRFSAPAQHPSRRAVGVAALAALDPDALRGHAARLTVATLDAADDRVDVVGALARRVPVRVLAERLGFADPDAVVPAVAAVAAAYHPGAEPAAVRPADRAVAALTALAPPEPFEMVANRIGLLVQACDATAGLICAGARHLLPPSAPSVGAGDSAELLAEVLRLDPPVRGTRRITTDAVRLGGVDLPAGTPLLLRFDAANRDPAVFAEPDVFRPGRTVPALTFGAGPRGCPGQRHALALAAGVLDVLRDRCRCASGPVRYEPHPLLRVPTRLEVVPR
ncbi:cytochrome P450 [Micromonospora krabiensis]|uniref:Cytochrome P450 n=1 Tax=Micromonospora krabiensis TaxID=307121 RepID=A0A1C3N113_9ACTN|nr:cytochrome P450 [Micromonospora krabiensis]SBV26269.1 Cytochrome P450 [Micromonospora krabiensis]